MNKGFSFLAAGKCEFVIKKFTGFFAVGFDKCGFFHIQFKQKSPLRPLRKTLRSLQ
jgi:hypothetical protein